MQIGFIKKLAIILTCRIINKCSIITETVFSLPLSKPHIRRSPILFRAYQSNHHIMRSWNTAVLPLICVLQTGLLSLSPSLSPSLDKHSQSIRYWTHTRSHPLPLISAAHTFPPGQCQSEITEGLCSLWKWEKPQVSSGTHSHSERDGPLNTERFISCYVKEWTEITFISLGCLKGLIHPKTTILSSFNHPSMLLQTHMIYKYILFHGTRN